METMREVTEAVRMACIEAALAAYEEGGVLGLCAEGRWEYAISAMRQVDLTTVDDLSASTLQKPTRQEPGF